MDVHLGSSRAVSRQHAVLRFLPHSRHFELSCLGKHALRVNGVALPPGAPRVLSHNDQLELGGVRLRFARRGEGPAAADDDALSDMAPS